MEDVTVAVMAVATAFICSNLQIFPVILFLLMLVDAPVVHPHVDLGSCQMTVTAVISTDVLQSPRIS